MNAKLIRMGLVAGLMTTAFATSIGWAANWKQTVVEKKTFDVGAGGTIVVKAKDADISVEGGSVTNVQIEVEISATDLEAARRAFADSSFSATASGNVVSIAADRLRDSGSGYNRGYGMNIRIKTPAQISVNARTADGDILINGIDGSLEAATADGDVRAANIAGEAASLRSKDGDIRMEDAKLSTAVLRSKDGDIVVRRVEAKSTNAETKDGDIEISLPKGRGAVIRLRGDEVQLKGTAEFEGEIKNRLANGTLNGGGSQLNAETKDGTVKLVF